MMPVKSNCVTYSSPRFNVLSEDQCEEILLATEEILAKTGVAVYDDEARDILKKAGCWVDGARVRIPSPVVERALRSAPQRVTLCNSRTGSRDVQLEGHNVYFGTGSDTPFFIDPYTQERKRCTKQLVGWACKCIDALPNLDFVMSLGIVQDVPALISDRHQFEAQVLNTGKPIVITAHNVDGYADIIEMCEIIAGGEDELRRHPFMTLYAEPISPLQHAWEAATKLVLAAKKGLPVVYTSGVMAGGTAPITSAGLIASGLAETLSGLVINQSTREGSPFIMGGVYTIMDMSTTIFSYGSPEFYLQMSGLADMAHFLKIPMFGACGCSDSCIMDEQASLESAISIAMTALSGPNLNHDVGYVEYGNCSSLDMLVVSNDIIGMARRLTRGITVNDQTLSLDLIDRIGPGGDFMSAAQTKESLRAETYSPDLIDRQTYDAWKANGAKTLQQRANEKTRSIIENYEPEQLPKDVKQKIRAIVERAESTLRS
jgi:trimethylamine--corrinoid protein Co-methyltransferase